MTITQVTYLTFAVVLLLALVIDLGMLSKKNSVVSIKKALYQTLFWVSLSLGFCLFLFFEKNSVVATKYFTAYLMEWSLSVDNIFVFILIFTFFKIDSKDIGRALLIGILLAIVLRIIFITIGIGLIERFHWLLYIFGAFLLYTGIRLFFQKEEDEFDPAKSKIYRMLTKFLRITSVQAPGKYMIKENGKTYFTNLALVVLMLAGIDLVFAMDSIPTVVSLVKEKSAKSFSEDDVLVIYSSNIFAVLGLRSLFFLLQGAVNKFDYLQQGIAVVLAFIGVKMLVEYFNIHISIYISLIVIVTCLAASILYSVYKQKSKESPDIDDSSI